MNYPMRPDLKVGEKFPDFELPDHTGSLKKRVFACSCSFKSVLNICRSKAKEFVFLLEPQPLEHEPVSILKAIFHLC